MAIDAKTLAASKKYTKETVEGAGAIKGKNCVIDSITPITGGNRVTFKWTLDNGTIKTSPMDVMNGINGQDGAQGPKGDPGTNGSNGISVQSMSIDVYGHLIITYSNGTTEDAGAIPGGSGAVDSVNGKVGTVILTTSDLENDSNFVADASYVHTDNNYTNADKAALTRIPLDISQLQGSLADKANKSEVPTKVSQLTNDSNFVADASYVHTDNNYTNADKAALTRIPLDISQLQGSLANKVDKVAGKQLSTEDYSTADMNKLRALLEIRSIGAGLNLDQNTKELTATGAAITIDSVLDKTSSNAIQNQAVAIPIEALQGSVLGIKLDISQLQGSLADKANKSEVPTKVSQLTNDSNFVADASYVHTDNNYTNADKAAIQDISNKADKVSNATNGNFAGLDTNGNLTDSGYKANDFATDNPAFTEASTRANIASGESLATIFGKIKKYFTDLKDLAFIAKDVAGSNKFLRGDGTWQPVAIEEWVGTKTVDSSGQVDFSEFNLPDSYGYDLYCRNKLIGISSMTRVASNGFITTLKYTVTGASTGDVCALRAIKDY